MISVKKARSELRKPVKRWVVKAGSNLVCSGGPLLVRAWMQQLAALRRQHGIEVIWVTSGAIASAVDKTGYSKKKRQLAEKQALSAIGQPMVMDLYNLALQNAGRMGAQILLTYDDLADSERRLNFQNTIEQLLAWNVVPVLNENDAVATDEIRFGDNDRLSAKVARYVSADRLVILTDVDGLYDKDPKKHRDARLIERVTGISTQVLKGVEPGAGSQRGTGGMFSKLKAAQEAGEYGIETWLLRGDLPDALVRIQGKEALGTLIRPPKRSS
jgi:glutamate 5-kinase